MNNKSFAKFKSKRNTWVRCFSLKDRNSIISQIYEMIWDAAVFKLINEARKAAPDNNHGQKEINGTIHYFIDKCFFDSQVLAIRRITDAKPLYGKSGVFSLVSVVKDMKENVSLMTRKNLFLAEGKEYDSESVEQRALDYRLSKIKNGQKSYWLPSELDSHRLQLRHKQIDILSCVEQDCRKPGDAIRGKIFDFLIKKINLATRSIKTYVDKNVAHAATQESRDYANADEVSITWDYLWEAHKAICQVASFVNLYILSEGQGGFLAIPQYDHLQFIDKPLVLSEKVCDLADAWRNFNVETDAWNTWGIDALEQEMTKKQDEVL